MHFYVKSPDRPEKEMPLTGSILSEVIPWATAEYHNYPFGNMLRQSFQNSILGFHKYLADLSEDSVVYPSCTQPTIAMQFMLEGHAACQMKGGKRATLHEGQVALFYLPKGRNRAVISPGSFYSKHFELDPVLLKDIASGVPEIDQAIRLKEQLHPSGVRFTSVPINYIMFNRLNSLAYLKTENLESNLRVIVSQLMNSYKDGLRDHEFLQSVLDCDHGIKLISIRNDILTSPTKTGHTAESFSLKYKIPKKRLINAFRLTFGIDLEDFILLHIIQNGTDLLRISNHSIAKIAQFLGYKSQNSFIKEFKLINQVEPDEIRHKRLLI